MRAGYVAVLGWTNVGKSTLVNRLVGAKIAAVSDVAQTTRHRITGVATLEGRGQVVFVDTPGIHDPRHRMNRAMVETAREALAGADVALLVVDAARGVGDGDAAAAAMLRSAGGPRIAALNKIDRVGRKELLLPMMRTLVETWGLEEAVPISAATGEGCDDLVRSLLARLPEGPPPFPGDTLTDRPERFLAAELIREKILVRTREEIPHATAVTIDRWEEEPSGLVRVHASVLVERESQKAIVIGRGGIVLKEAGTEARRELESMLGARVFLELRVRVARGWRDDDRVLHGLDIT